METDTPGAQRRRGPCPAVKSERTRWSAERDDTAGLLAPGWEVWRFRVRGAQTAWPVKQARAVRCHCGPGHWQVASSVTPAIAAATTTILTIAVVLATDLTIFIQCLRL